MSFIGIVLMAAVGLGFPDEPGKPLFLPQPKRVILEDSFTLHSSYCPVIEGNVIDSGDPGISILHDAFISRNITRDYRASLHISISKISESQLCKMLLQAIGHRESLPEMPEAYFVRLAPENAVVGGHTPRAIHYGLLTLAQWIESARDGRVRGGWVLDWPSLEHRGLMVDPARLVEKKSYYGKILKFLSRCRYNVLVLHLTDDPTIALRFTKHPGPADPEAWTPDAMRDFVSLATQYHVDVLPEIELFGHARGWTRHPDYEDLAEPGTASLSPHNPGTYTLIQDLVEETADIFPCELLHAGLDEVQSPTSSEGRSFVSRHGKGRWFSDHTRSVHEMITGVNRRMVMWGDMLLAHPEAAHAIPRDTLIYDWHYEHDFDDKKRKWRTRMPPESWSFFRELGFEVVAAPALQCNVYRLWPDNRRLENTLKTARLAAEFDIKGMTTTIWLPPRYLPDAVWYSFALSGDAAWSGTGFDRNASEDAFFFQYFGLTFSDEDRKHLHFLLDHTPTWHDFARLLWTIAQPPHDRTDYVKVFLEHGGHRVQDCLEGASAALEHFEKKASHVRRHADEYEELLLAARVIHHLAWRDHHGKAVLTDPGAEALREECRRRTEKLLVGLKTSWGKHRHEDYSRAMNCTYCRYHVIRQDFEDALEGLDEMPERIKVRTLLEKEVLEQGQPIAEVQSFIEDRIARMPEVKSVAEWEETAERLRQEILDRVVFRGDAEIWRYAPTLVEWLETIPGGPGYRIRKLRYEALPGLWIPALLYEPDNLSGRVPLVLNVNGHSCDKGTPYKQIRCINQAKRGMLALNVEWLGRGQLAGGNFRHGRMNQLDLCGTSGLAPFYLAMTRGLDVLLDMEHADPERVAVTGLSGGGWQTIVLASLDTRVKLANPVAGYASYFTRARHLNDLGDSEQTPVDLASIADYTHLTALMAPRPTLLTYNTRDTYFASGRALSPLLEAAEPVFDLFGHRDRLRSHVNDDPGTHNFERDNREALYRMLGNFFFPGRGDYDASEIPCEEELKTREQLHVDLPEDNLDIHSLAVILSRDLPKEPQVPEEEAAFEEWQRERISRLSEIVRAKSYEVEAERTGQEERGGIRAAFWRLKVGEDWTVAAVELARGETDEAVILVSDRGRAGACERAIDLLEEGKRVLAVDPFYFGESALGRYDWLFALLLSSSGERPLGVQAGQLAAIARWLRDGRGVEKVTIASLGPRSSTFSLIAAALEGEAVAGVECHDAFRSLKDVIHKNWTVEQAPELFCFGLLEAFDLEQIVELIKPRPVIFH